MSWKYLIEELWIDPMENRDTDGYEVIGYVDNEEQAREFCLTGRTFTQEDCWSLFSPKSQYTYKKIFCLDQTKF